MFKGEKILIVYFLSMQVRNRAANIVFVGTVKNIFIANKKNLRERCGRLIDKVNGSIFYKKRKMNVNGISGKNIRFLL